MLNKISNTPKMGKTTTKTLHCPDTSAYHDQINAYETFYEHPLQQKQHSAFRLSESSEQLVANKVVSSSSFKIEDILNSTASLRKHDQQQHLIADTQDYLNKLDTYQRSTQMRAHFLKENAEDPSRKMSKNVSSSSSSSTSSSSSSSSSSSYCSPISSTSSSSYQNSIENLIGMPNVSHQSTHNGFPLFANPFTALTNGQLNASYQKLIETNSQYSMSFADHLALQQQHQSHVYQHQHLQSQNYLAMEDLIKTTLSSKVLSDSSGDVLNRESDTKKKLDLIDEIAKKIDAFSETANSKSAISSAKKVPKKQNKVGKMSSQQDENHAKKSKKSSKKRSTRDIECDNDEDDDDDDDEDECGDVCGCSDLACCK